MSSKLLLKLYITGQTPTSERAIKNLHKICEEYEYELSIVNVLEQPQLAEDEKIIATPTLVKVLPPPAQRIIGDLSDTERVLLGLNIYPQKNQGGTE